MRAAPADFMVDERMDIEFSHEGEHLWLQLEKTNWTTPQVAAWLAQHFELRERDIGFSGLKDRHAVTRQWFSIPTPQSLNADALPEGITLLDQQRHARKLRRGTHRANAFQLNLREVAGSREQIEADLATVQRRGLPNYFGNQRFAGGRNLQAAYRLFSGARLKRTQRSMALSAARSLLFNEVLSTRVRAQNWDSLLPGEAVMLNGSHSVFAWPVDSPQELAELDTRLAAFDIHPSGPLPGSGVSVAQGQAAALEEDVSERHPDLVEGLQRFGVKQARRALRIRPDDLTWSWLDETSLQLRFSLAAGEFATTVLREVLGVREN